MPEIPKKSPKVLGGAGVLWMHPVSAHESPEIQPPLHKDFVGQAILDYESPLIAYATSLLRDSDLARDAVQETFIRLCRQDIAKVTDNLKSWLFTVCRNRCLDMLRKDKRAQPLDDMQWEKIVETGLQPDEHAQQQERFSRLMATLKRLPANQSEVILLKFQHDLSYQQIQQITGLTTGNIGFLIHTGLNRLRAILPDDLK